MRGIFFLLLTANALFFIWHYFYEQPARTSPPFTVPTSNDGVAKLVLAAEATPGTLQIAGQQPAALETAEDPSELEPVNEAMEMVSAPEATDAEMLAEADPVSAPVVEPVVEAEPLPPVCYTLGPVADTKTQSKLHGIFSAEKMQAEKRTTEEVASVRYWVMIPPRKSKRVATKLLKELKQKKIDSFVIVKGEYSRGISLGVFKEKSSAQRLLKRIRSQGYREAKVDPIERMHSVYWLDVVETDGYRQDEADWETISGDYPDLKRSERMPCE